MSEERPRKNETTEFGPAIRRAKMAELVIFDVAENELEILERGSPDSVLLNLAIAGASFSVAFLISLLTTDIKDIRVFCVFVILTAITALSALVLGLLWWRSRRTVWSVVQIIRKRLNVADAMPQGMSPQGSDEK